MDNYEVKTEAAVLYETGKPLAIEELDVPPLKRGEVLLKISYSGICHSQINEINALKGEDKYLPHLLGHEASGTVESVGEGVTKVKVGDYVVVSWIKGSGLDSSGVYYSKGDERINAGSAATFSRYAIVAENRVNKISKRVPSDIAALLGCAIPTGGGIILNDVVAKSRDTIAIFGIGGLGASALAVASGISMFSKIIAIDISDPKLALAKQLGATHTINALKEDVIDNVRKITEGKGVDFAIETAGSKIAMESAFIVIKDGRDGKEGGLAIIAGNISKSERIDIQPFDLIKGKRIKGTWGGSTNPDKDIPIYERLYLEGKLNLEKLISKTYCLKEINNALKELKEGEILVRGVIKFD